MPKKLIDPRSSITEETSRRIANALEYIAIADAKDIDITDYQQIANIVKAGRAKDFFEIGDQIMTTWSPDGETEYDMPWAIVDFGPVTDPDGVVHENAMWLQSWNGIKSEYDGFEAFYVTSEEMPAGMYHFRFGLKMLPTTPANEPFMFTLTKPVPAKGILVFGSETKDNFLALATNINNGRIRVYSDGLKEDPDEIVPILQGENGVDLGLIKDDIVYSDYGLNNIFRLVGYNRWSQSAVRQWLNSDKPANEWWKQQNPFDRKPLYLIGQRGFRAGLQNDFKSIIKRTKVVNALNDVDSASIGEYEVTDDYFFISSLSQSLRTYSTKNEGAAFKANIGKLRDITDNSKFLKNMFRSAYLGNAGMLACISQKGSLQKTFGYDTTNGSCPCCVIY